MHTTAPWSGITSKVGLMLRIASLLTAAAGAELEKFSLKTWFVIPHFNLRSINVGVDCLSFSLSAVARQDKSPLRLLVCVDQCTAHDKLRC